VRHEILDADLVDNVKSRVLRKDGAYVRTWQAEGKRKPPLEAVAFSAQDFLLGLAEGKQAVEAMPAPALPKGRRLATVKGR